MNDMLRRIYNAIEVRLDRKAILEERKLSADGGSSRHPVTARQALDFVLPAARKYDRQARLKSIVSPSGLSPDGLSAQWEFFFDLPQRRARLNADWTLIWDITTDAYAPASLILVTKPFPPAASPLHQLVKDGKLLHQQLVGLWKQEMQKSLYLPDKFQDSDTAAAAFSRQGLDLSQIDFSLSTGLSPTGQLAWIAQTREKEYYVDFVSTV